MASSRNWQKLQSVLSTNELTPQSRFGKHNRVKMSHKLWFFSSVSSQLRWLQENHGGKSGQGNQQFLWFCYFYSYPESPNTHTLCCYTNKCTPQVSNQKNIALLTPVLPPLLSPHTLTPKLPPHPLYHQVGTHHLTLSQKFFVRDCFPKVHR